MRATAQGCIAVHRLTWCELNRENVIFVVFLNVIKRSGRRHAERNNLAELRPGWKRQTYRFSISNLDPPESEFSGPLAAQTIAQELMHRSTVLVSRFP